MKVKKIIFFILILTISVSHRALAISVFSNGGIIPSTIWYSKEPLVEGDTVKIHTVVYNNEPQNLYGTVFFMDGEVLLGKKDFKALPDTISDVSIDWLVTAGNHAISANIENPHIIDSSGKSQTITITKSETSESKQFVDHKVLFKKNDESTKVANDVFDQVGKVEKTAGGLIPEPVKNFAGQTFDSVESWRNSNVENTKKEISETKKSLLVPLDLSAPKGSIKSSKKFSDSPFDFIKIFALEAWAMFLASKVLFYGSIALITFLILRFAWVKIFK